MTNGSVINGTDTILRAEEEKLMITPVINFYLLVRK